MEIPNEIPKEKWKSLQPGIRQRWTQLSDDELENAEGKEERIIDLLEKKYGYSNDEAKRELDKFVAEQEDLSKLKPDLIKDPDKVYE